MSGVDARPVAASAGRNLISYSILIDRMRLWAYSLNVCKLWRDVFGDAPPRGMCASDLECEFIGRVHYELFPINLQVLDSLLEDYDDESGPLDQPIPIDGYRIPWEACPVSDMIEYMQPVAAAIQNAREDAEAPEWLRPHVDRSVVDAALDDLAGRGAPWDGLADLVRLAIRPPANNPWLSQPDVFWQMEYVDCFPYYWEADQVRELARLYAEARPVIDRIEAYINWYCRQPDEAAYDLVMQMLWQVDPGREEDDEGEDHYEVG